MVLYEIGVRNEPGTAPLCGFSQCLVLRLLYSDIKKKDLKELLFMWDISLAFTVLEIKL